MIVDTSSRPRALKPPSPSDGRAVVVGAGMGGLACAIRLAARGVPVTVIERAATPGGKLRAVMVDGAGIDSGPTVFTMRDVFEDLFAAAGATLADHLRLTPAQILARHAWDDGSRLDLYADRERSADAIGDFAGAAAAGGYRAFCDRVAAVHRTLRARFMETARPSPLSLGLSGGVTGIPELMRIRPFSTLWSVVGDYFPDPRLRQLFGRYATYCGSSPFASPGPLMLIAHVEQEGVWLVEGGMVRLAEALVTLAERLGVDFRFGCHVEAIELAGDGARGVRLATGERIDATAVVFNGDPAALSAGLLGERVAAAGPRTKRRDRSLSAMTWSLRARTRGFALAHHTVFFSSGYRAEFDEIFREGRLPRDPTIYVCAQDRGDAPEQDLARERLFLLVNAPATGDGAPFDPEEIARCETMVQARLARAGLEVSEPLASGARTTPTDFERLFPATGGALYGRASHGWLASFRRPFARTHIPNLYLVGGGTHPGAGLPMAALSGRHAAMAVLEDLASRTRFHPAAMPGGMSTRSATTAVTR